MRIRSIKPEFFTHEGLYEAEQESKLPLRVAFIGLWCAADREGRFRWEPRRLGVQILPYDNADFSRVLHALTTRGFVVRYRVGDASFGCIPSFLKHQVINNRESGSSLPEMTAESVESLTISRDDDASGTREPHEEDACEGEGKGREGKGTTSRIPKADEPVGFPEFWECYPKKVNKQDAITVWKRLSPDLFLKNQIIASVNRRKTTEDWTKEGGKFIMGPDRFLRGKHWEDLLDAIETRESLEARLRAHPGWPNGVGYSISTDEEKAEYRMLLERRNRMMP